MSGKALKKEVGSTEKKKESNSKAKDQRDHIWQINAERCNDRRNTRSSIRGSSATEKSAEERASGCGQYKRKQ